MSSPNRPLPAPSVPPNKKRPDDSYIVHLDGEGLIIAKIMVDAIDPQIMRENGWKAGLSRNCGNKWKQKGELSQDWPRLRATPFWALLLALPAPAPRYHLPQVAAHVLRGGREKGLGS